MEPQSSVGSAVVILVSTIQIGQTTRSHIDSCQLLVERLLLLKNLLDDVEVVELTNGQAAAAAFERLEHVIRKAKELLDRCSRPCYKVYMAVRSVTIRQLFQDVALELDRCVNAIPMICLKPSESIRMQVTRLSSQLKALRFSVDPQNVRVVKDIELMVLEQRRGLELSRDLMRRVARELDLRTHDDLKMEEAAITREMAVARAEKDAAEEAKLSQIISLLQVMDQKLVGTGWVEDGGDRAGGAGGVRRTLNPPREYLCPLSLDIMADPVQVSSGESYERGFIQKWIEQGELLCPVRGQPLDRYDLKPNNVLRAAINKWCRDNKLGYPKARKLDPSVIIKGPLLGLRSAEFGIRGPKTLPADTWGGGAQAAWRKPPSPHLRVTSRRTVRPSARSSLELPDSDARELLAAGAAPGAGLGAGDGGPLEDLGSGVHENGGASPGGSTATSPSASPGPGSLGQEDSPPPSAEMQPPILEIPKPDIRSEGDADGYPPPSAPSDSPRGAPYAASPNSPSDFRLNHSGNKFSPRDIVGRNGKYGILPPSPRTAAEVAFAKGRSLPSALRNPLPLDPPQGTPTPRFCPSPVSSDGNGGPGGLAYMSNRYVGSPAHSLGSSSHTSEAPGGAFGLDRIGSMPALEEEVTSASNHSRDGTEGAEEEGAGEAGGGEEGGEGRGFGAPSSSPLELVDAMEIRSLVDGLSRGTRDEKLFAASRIRQLSKTSEDARSVVGEMGAIKPLIALLVCPDSEVAEGAVFALLNLSIHDGNKSEMVNLGVISRLIRLLQAGGEDCKEGAAATLFSLSVLDENKVVIGASGAIPLLVEVVKIGTKRAKKDALLALFNLSLVSHNKIPLVQARAAEHMLYIVRKGPSVFAHSMVEKAVGVVGNMAFLHEGRTAIQAAKGIPILARLVEEGSPRAKEDAAACLLRLCVHSTSFRTQIWQEDVMAPLMLLAAHGTARGQLKAKTLLQQLNNRR